MKTYTGKRTGAKDTSGETMVRVIENGDSRTLPARLDLRNHSPTGFNWGYAGSGPAQLALAIVADVTNDDGTALHTYMDFKRGMIAAMGKGDWRLTESEVLRFLVALVSPSCCLMREGGRVYRICGHCGIFLEASRMVERDIDGVVSPVAGVTLAQIRTAAKAHHGPPE